MSNDLNSHLLSSTALSNATPKSPPSVLPPAPSSAAPIAVEPAIQIPVDPRALRIDHLTITKSKLIRIWCGKTCPEVLAVSANYSPSDADLAARFGSAFQRLGYDTRIVRIGARIAGYPLKLTLRCPRIRIGDDPEIQVILPPSIDPDWKMDRELLKEIRDDLKCMSMTKIVERRRVTSEWIEKLLFVERDKALDGWRSSGHSPIFIGVDRVYVSQIGRRKRQLVTIVFSDPLCPLHYIHRVLDVPSDAALTAALARIFRDLPDPDCLLAICLDYEWALASSVGDALAQAATHVPTLAKVQIVIDRFHALRPFGLVMKKCINRARLDLYKELKRTGGGDTVIRSKVRFLADHKGLLTMRLADIESEARKLGQYRALICLFPDLGDAYLLLEGLRRIYDASSRCEAVREFKKLYCQLPKHLKTTARRNLAYLLSRKNQVLGYFDIVERGFEHYGSETRLSVTTSPTEGANKKLKELRAKNRGRSIAVLDALAVITGGYVAQVESRSKIPQPARTPEPVTLEKAIAGEEYREFELIAVEIQESLVDDVLCGRLDKKKKPKARKDVPTDENEYDDSMEIAV